MGEPVPFITISETNHFEVDPRAVELLSQLQGPICVIAVAGLYRTGKSFLLNKLVDVPVGDPSGFAVGSTVNACTKGLWIWGAPHALPDGSHLLYIDTEGLGSTSRSATEDSRIFALALLLASTFIYNSRGVIDNNVLDELSVVVELTKHIHVSSAQTNPEDLASIFPSFLWVLRDFSLRLQHEGKAINSRQYLESALQVQSGFSGEKAAKNQVRRMLATVFPQRDCVCLVRPVNDEEALHHLADLPLEQLRPEFIAGLQTLKQHVAHGARPKRVNGQTVNGPMLATLAAAYAAAINEGGVPTISTAWERVVSTQCQDAVNAAVNAYDEHLRDTEIELPLEEEPELRQLHQAAVANANQRFTERSLEGASQASFRHELAELLRQRWHDLCRRNVVDSERVCAELLLELKADVEAALSGDSLKVALQNWQTHLQSLVAEFRSRAKGPGKHKALASFLEGDAVSFCVKRVSAEDTQTRQAMSTLRQELKAAQRTAEAQTSKVAVATELHQAEMAGMQRAMAESARASAAEVQAVTVRLEDRTSEVAGARHAVELLEASHTRELQLLRDGKAAAEREATEAKVALLSARDEADEARRRAERELLLSERQAREDSSRMTAELARVRADLERATRKKGRGGDEEGGLMRTALDTARDAQRVAEEAANSARCELVEARAELRVVEERHRSGQTELALLREHCALAKDHLSVSQERFGVTEARVQEAEYQWAVAKAKIAQLESEHVAYEIDVGTLEAIVAALKPRAVRHGRMPSEVTRALDDVQRARLDAFPSS